MTTPFIRCSVKVTELATIHEIDGAWSDQDYIELLDRMNFPDAEKNAPEELRELLFMAISDFEPHEAAEIILSYKLSNHLSRGQIQNLAVEMIEDKVAEEYSDIALHYALFNINQLLNKAYNGRFPDTKASRLKLEFEFHHNKKIEPTKEIVLKAICNGLDERNLIKRLFPEQLAGEAEFPETEHIIWKLEESDDGTISIITSDYWINEEDLLSYEFEGVIHEFEHEQE